MTNIVMIARDRHRLLAQTLESLYAHTPREEFNLVIVDDGSEDFRTLKLLTAYAEHANCAVVSVLNSGHVLAQLKNLGAAAAEQFFGRGDWLYFSDSDVWFAPDWLEKLTSFAESGEPESFRLWGGQAHPFHKPQAVRGDLDERFITYSVLDGPSWLMRWDTWERFGPLQRDCAPGTCQSEEYPFCRALTDAGYRIGVIHPHVVVHTGLTNTSGADAPGANERRAMIPKGVLAE